MRPVRSAARPLLAIVAGCVSALALPATAEAQYFGRNKVQYETFDFKVLETEHFDVYYYAGGEEIIPQAARMAERWYARISRVLDHQLQGRQPLILYLSHPGFEQTNAVFGEIGESTGGVTEVLKRRIVLPLAGPLKESDHVIGHELVHAFQFDATSLAGEGGVGFRGPTALLLPLWFIEGMAEYLSVGPIDPHTAMWMRDAAAGCCLPTLKDLESYRYFPYRWGQAFWAFVGGRWGDEAIGKVLKVAGRSGNPYAALDLVLQTPVPEIEAEWHAAIRQAYAAVAEPFPDSLLAAAQEGDDEARNEIKDEAEALLRKQHGPARLLFSKETGSGGLNVGPALSPDGKKIVFLSEKSLFSIEMYVADVETGEIQRRLTKTATDPHFESLQFINSSGAWSPDSRLFAFGSIVKGDPALTIIDPSSGDKVKEFKYPELGEIYTPKYAPDGRHVVFSGLVNGYTDLFVADTETGDLRRLTTDLYSDLQPDWSPDGASIVFVTDRFSTDLSDLDYGNYRLGLIDPESGDIQALPVFSKGKHIDPQWSPDGQSVYFVSDVSGISNVYRYDVRGGGLYRVTDLITGVSGITALSPVISVSRDDGRLAYTAYEEGDYDLYLLTPGEAEAGTPIQEATVATVSPATLPPQDRAPGLITTLLGEPRLGLVDPVTFTRHGYNPSLSLDYVSQPQLGAGVDRYGAFLAGGISLYFSDMLGNRNLGTLVNVNTAYGSIFKSTALLASYENRRTRWNWGFQGGQLPYVARSFSAPVQSPDGSVRQLERRQWQISRQVGAFVSYPFSRAQRWELAADFRNIDFSDEIREQVFDPFSGALLDERTTELPSPPSLNVGSMSTALVYDNTVFGGTGPILGQRYRLEVSPQLGDLNFYTVLADFRKYLLPVSPITLAGRVIHFGRYGADSEARWGPEAPEEYQGSLILTPLYLGYPTLIRGYNSGSFDAKECQFDTNTVGCPVYDQLFGSRVAAANFEVRVPVLGFFGLIRSPGLPPLELAPFFDAGVAWNRDFGPRLSCSGTTPEGDVRVAGVNCRQVVTSYGIAGRLNLLGFLIIEADFVHPNDRPDKGWYWQFNLLPAF
jgi:Tol biopolymer transport system component